MRNVNLDNKGEQRAVILMHFSKFNCRKFNYTADKLAANGLTVLKMPELQIVLLYCKCLTCSHL